MVNLDMMLKQKVLSELEDPIESNAPLEKEYRAPRLHTD